MASIKIKRQHTLGLKRAREKADEIGKKLQEKFNTSCVWQGDSKLFYHSGASGSVDVGEETIELTIKLGMLLSPMKRSIQRAVEEQIDEVLS